MRLCSLFKNTRLHAWKSATNKQFNGQGLTAPPTSPDLKESGGRLKGERLHLMEKLQFPILAASPVDAVRATKQGFVFVFRRNLRPWGRGCKWYQRRGSRLKCMPWPPQATPSPGVPWLPVAQGDRHFSLSAEEPSNRCLRLSHSQPSTGADPAGRSPLVWPEDQCPVAALGHKQERSSTPLRTPNVISSCAKNLFTSDSHAVCVRGNYPKPCAHTESFSPSAKRQVGLRGAKGGGG